MTRQQAISRWKDIASAVFWAEENLSKEWNNRLKEAPSLDKDVIIMAQYIDKSALVAEIKGYISNYKEIVAKTNRNDSTWVDSVSMIDAKIDVLQHVLFFLDTLKVKDIQEKPVSEDLEEAANSCSSCIYLEEVLSDDDKEVLKERLVNTFKAGAKWQKEQFEKNRIEHCDSITEEQYNLETGFIDYYIDKYNRMPTFLDAIEYGMKKAQKGE